MKYAVNDGIYYGGAPGHVVAIEETPWDALHGAKQILRVKLDHRDDEFLVHNTELLPREAQARPPQ